MVFMRIWILCEFQADPHETSLPAGLILCGFKLASMRPTARPILVVFKLTVYEAFVLAGLVFNGFKLAFINLRLILDHFHGGFQADRR